MKHPFFKMAALVGALSLNAIATDAAAETKITEKIEDSGQDSSILIQKKTNPKFEQDFENLTETEDLVGDNVGGKADARKSWDSACEKWKAEVRANHKETKDTKVLSLSCGRPQLVKDPSNNGNYSYESQAKVTFRVRMKDPQ